MPARHILTWARDLSGGGVERAQLRLAAGWIAGGRRVTLVLGSDRGPLAAELPAGLELVVLGSPTLRSLLELPRVVRATTPSILFCAGNYYTGIAAATRWRLGRNSPPILGKMSNAPRRADHGPVTDLAHRLWLAGHGRFLDRLVAMTPATAAAAERACRMPGRVDVIPNPPARGLPGAAQPPLPPGPFVLGVGRLAPQKRWDRLVAALPHLPVPVVILGEGGERERLRTQAARLGVGDRLHLPGHAADPLPAMARAAAVALVSDFEGVPGVLREALSVGTPVVATDSSPAVREIVDGPMLGDVVPRDDPAALLAALRRRLHAPRPAPVPQPGDDAAQRYLAVMDRMAGDHG
jgi:glycosyltransferase involved in cell wall biosynthesis